MDARDGNVSVDVPKVMVDNVRELLSDDTMSNELIEGREFSDLAIAKHLVAIVYDFNSATPIISETVSFPSLLGGHSRLRPWVEEAAAGRALKYGAIRRMRNNMPYSAGNVSFEPNAVGASLLALANDMLNTWESRRNNYKVQLNLMGAFQVANSDLLVREIYEHGGIVSVVGGVIS